MLNPVISFYSYEILNKRNIVVGSVFRYSLAPVSFQWTFDPFTTEITELLAPGKKRSIALEFWAYSHDHLERPEWSRDIFPRLGLAIAMVMAVYQVKVYYCTDFHKCGTFFTSSTEDFSFYGFISRAKDIKPKHFMI